MQIVAGLSLKNLQPRVWDSLSPYHITSLKAVMVSYAELHENPAARRRAMDEGLHAALGIPDRVEIYLDNGAFYFSSRDTETDIEDYRDFVVKAHPDWRPVSQDFIPSPNMTLDQQRECLARTMAINLLHADDGYVPIIHISRVLAEYIEEVQRHDSLTSKEAIALGGIVPNLLRAPKAMPYADILAGLRQVRQNFGTKQLHVFGLGGTATLHLAALLGVDSVDSSGWRNRAARGIVQLPGSGDRTVANLGSWRGREPSSVEWEQLQACRCPACSLHGTAGLKAAAITGFCHRATHNLWVLLEEARWLEEHLSKGTYDVHYRERLDNSNYLALVEKAAELARQGATDQQ